MDTRDPRSLIPHRPPILCIDRILTVSDRSASTEHTVPGDGRMWEPFLLEGLAQTAAVLDGGNSQNAGPRKGMLVGTRGLRIARLPRAGETVRYEVDLIKRLGQLTLIDGTAWIGEERIASGNLKFYVEDL